MRITCLHCGHTEEVNEERLPAGAIRVTCPLCRQRFPLDMDKKWPVPATGEDIEKTAPRPPTAPTESPPAASQQEPPPSRPFAGFWIRAAAALVDSVAVGLLQVGMALLFTAVLQRLETILAAGFHANLVHTWAMLFTFVIGIAYYVFFTGYCGQTPGKMALRIQVVRDGGGEVGYGRALLRETVGKFLSAALFCVGYLMVAFTRRKQGLHDQLAGTLVVKVN